MTSQFQMCSWLFQSIITIFTKQIEHVEMVIDKKKIKYDQWKKSYDIRREKERYDFLKPLSLTFFLVAIIAVIFYGLYSGEYKFIAQKTDTVNGVIYQPERTHLGRGVYVQKIKYSYRFNNENYHGSKVLFRSTGVRKKGDSLKLKISTSNPERHKILGFYNDTQ